MKRVRKGSMAKPTMNPAKKVAVSWRKMLNLSPIPSCTLIRSLCEGKEGGRVV